jgi:hypothetical protein
VSVSTTSVSSILSSLSAALFTTIVPTSESSRGPKPIFGAGCAHLELVPVHAAFSAFPHERHMSDLSGYRTDLSTSFQAPISFHAPTWFHASASFHALRKALLHKALHLV